MPKPFRKAISDFSGGIVDYFSSRDIQDNQFQEFENLDNSIPGRLERFKSDLEVSGSSTANNFIAGAEGANHHLYSTEWAEGNFLEKTVSKLGHADYIDRGLASSSASDNDILRVDLGANTRHKLSVGETIEILDNNSPILYGLNQVARVVNIVDDNIFDIRVKFNIGHTNLDNTALTSVSNVKVRYLPEATGALWSTVFGTIGSNPQTGLTSNTPGFSRTPANQAQNAVSSDNITIATPTENNAFKFVNGNSYTSSGGSFPPTPYDMIIHTGYGFKDSSFKVGQTIKYVSSGDNGYTPYDGTTATIVSIDENGYAIHLNTSGTLAVTSNEQDYPAYEGFYSGELSGYDATWVDREFDGWSTLDKSRPVFYSHGGVLRVSDANFYNTGNKNKWFGFINSPRYGNDIDTGKSPKSRKPDIATNIKEWRVSDNTLAPPTVVKMAGWGDPTGQVINAGEVGLFVYDPRTYEDIPLNRREHIMYPDAVKRDAFSDLDRYACTFIYDGANESELSRDEEGNIGIDGFKVITPEEIPDNDFLVTYEDAPLTTPVEHEVKVVSYDTGTYDAGDRACTKVRLSSETDGVDGAHKVLKEGDIIRAGSEKMMILKIDAHAGSNAWVTFNVHRAILGTEPFDATGMNVYRVQQRQKARAMNLVLCANDNTPASTTLTDGSSNITLTANKALGANANGKINIEFDWSAGSTGNATITTLIDPSDEKSLNLKVVLVRNGYDIRDVHIVDAINNGAVNNGAASANIDVTVTHDISQFVTASTTTTGSGVLFNNNSSALLGAGTPGVNVNALNPRITGINLYWNPYGDADWYLVNYYDIEKGWSKDI